MKHDKLTKILSDNYTHSLLISVIIYIILFKNIISLCDLV
jgi:hypothetical protein